jgi:hypothetical protein
MLSRPLLLLLGLCWGLWGQSREIPTLFLIGDSTVRNGQGTGGGGAGASRLPISSIHRRFMCGIWRWEGLVAGHFSRAGIGTR